LAQGDAPEPLLAFVADRAHRFIEGAGLEPTDLVGSGFGAPAFLQGDTLTLWGETLPPWHKVPVRMLLEDALGVPVLLGNDADFMALAESLRLATPERVLVYLVLRQGAYGDVRMGGAVLIAGEVYLGAHGNAVSLREAHVKLGCAKRLGKVLSEGLTAADDPAEMRQVLEEHLLVPMINLVTLFDPGRLIIQARLLGEEEERFIQNCARQLKAYLREGFEELQVSRAREGEWACARGAALFALQDLFSDDEHLIERLLGRSTRKRGVRAPGNSSF
jgi:predicted NBD/HSP70 family sugar kinase